MMIKICACVDELPAVDLLTSRPLCSMFDIQPVSDDNSRDIEMYKVVSLPLIIERYVTAPIRAQLVSCHLYAVCCVLSFHTFVNEICLHLLIWHRLVMVIFLLCYFKEEIVVWLKLFHWEKKWNLNVLLKFVIAYVDMLVFKWMHVNS